MSKSSAGKKGSSPYFFLETPSYFTNKPEKVEEVNYLHFKITYFSSLVN